MVLFIRLYKLVLTFESVDEIFKCDKLLIRMYFPVLMFTFRTGWL